MAQGREQKAATGGGEGDAGDVAGGGPDPQKMMLAQRVKAANSFNEAHADLVEQFNKATDGSCAGGGAGGVDVQKVIAWQRAHGLKGDGKIGPGTLKAAQAEKPQEEVAEQGGDPPGGVTPAGAGKPGDASPASKMEEATISAEPADEEDGPAGELVAGGNTVSEQSRPKEKDGEASKEGGEWGGEGVDKSLDGVAGDGLKGEAVAKGAAAIARMPHVIHLVKEKKYEEAVSYIRDVLGYEDYVEVLKLLAEQMSIPLEEIAEAVPLLGKAGQAIEIGASTVDVLLIGYEFQKGALEALAKAHEEGERDNLIYMYSSAWAHSFLWGAGSYSNPGAIAERQKQAVADGNSEGGATAGGLGEKAPEIGKKLIEHYGTPENAERALVDVLLKRAGIEGVRFHSGKEGKDKKGGDGKQSERPNA